MRYDGLYGFCPIVPDVSWVSRLLPLGLRTLRLELDHGAHDAAREAVALGRAWGCQLVLAGNWEAALDARATHVHLSQAELQRADVNALQRAGIQLGVAASTPDELERALHVPLGYVALGPMYTADPAEMLSASQALRHLGDWKALLPCPLVATGDITLERALDVLDAGADALAVGSDVCAHPSPEARTLQWLRLFHERSLVEPGRASVTTPAPAAFGSVTGAAVTP
jgi:thiamine-phosphate pyrophosphorylase